jgi:hypothetical protein
MSANTRDPIRQDTPILDQGDPAERGVVETGDRRDEIHFEPDGDPDQMVVAHHLARPAGPLPPDLQGPTAEASDADAPPVEDVRVAPERSSVWDARPAEDDRSAEP